MRLHNLQRGNNDRDCSSAFIESIIAKFDQEEMLMPATATPVTYGSDASIAQFSVARYQRMVETGILTPEDKVELLENYVVLKMPRNPPHDNSIDRVDDAIRPHRPVGWRLRIQSSIVI